MALTVLPSQATPNLTSEGVSLIPRVEYRAAFTQFDSAKRDLRCIHWFADRTAWPGASWDKIWQRQWDLSGNISGSSR